MDQDQPSPSDERPVDAERAHSTLRTMPDDELADLHAQDPKALKPGAWDMVDQEVRRRVRVRARQASEERSMEPYDEGERYPALRAIVFMLKAIAVVALLIAVVVAASAFPQTRAPGTGPFAALAFLLAGVILAISYWASAEILVLLMDIEHNTRSTRR